MPWWSDDVSVFPAPPAPSPEQVDHARRVDVHYAAQRASRTARTMNALHAAGESAPAWRLAWYPPSALTEGGLWYQCADASAALALQSRLATAGLEVVIPRHGDEATSAQGGCAGRIVYVAARDEQFHDAVAFAERWQVLVDVYRQHVAALAAGDAGADRAAVQAQDALYQWVGASGLGKAAQLLWVEAIEGRGPDALPRIGLARAAGHALRRKRG